MRETAYAKINLALHIRSHGPDGYHSIETLFAFCEDGDELSAAASAELTLDVTGPFAPNLGDSSGNLVLHAAQALSRHCGIERGAALTLDKRVPIASGIGGGSADAAAALRLLMRVWQVEVGERALHDIAAGLGSDVPACLRSRTVRGEGRGDRLLPVGGEPVAGTPILLVNPRVPLATAAVFVGWDGRDRGPLPEAPPLAAAKAGRNDLEASARSMAPVVGEMLAELARLPGRTLSRMSGSGATCFALFDSERQRDAAAAGLALSHPHWWQLASRLR
ncbi:MAG TPA: 4-(cytidine 5'-diphospho)-2-C-methyl-D-erythritol kinase [Allosphingosinicella sp.]|nr:4-(cytidine 5'-diphospho)-2-C-methyl-D-erythritol kinase [Allosphingosinicella sp.]